MTSTAALTDSWEPRRRRLEHWNQTPETRIPDAESAGKLIDRVGLATVYPASSEVANLFHAHVGDPQAKTEPTWDSPSGFVYGWRWALGRKKAAFYGTVVRKRPTFVSWPLLPAVLRLIAELRTPDELYDFGVISTDAYRIAQVLENAPSPVGTGDLRDAAGFPTGKEQRAAYHRALGELESRLLITSEFMEDEEGIKHHGLIFVRHRDHVEAAERMSREEALDSLLLSYLSEAVYVLPATLAKHLRLSSTEVTESITRLLDEGRIQPTYMPGSKAACYVWSG